MNEEIREWEFTIGLVKGVLFGFRKYEYTKVSCYAFYLLFIVFTLEIED